MKRAAQQIADQADDLAQQFEDYEPATDERTQEAARQAAERWRKALQILADN